MAEYTTVLDATNVSGELVESVRIRRTDTEKYPSGWDYALHLGTLADFDILRYDNAHERSIGHERHLCGSAEEVNFPGMFVRLIVFENERDLLERLYEAHAG